MRVSDLMTTSVITLKVHDDLDLAVGILDIMRIRHLPVVDAEGILVGLVTHRDLLTASASSIGDPARGSRVSVRSLMRTKVSTVRPDADVREAIRVLQSRKFGGLPVVDDARRLVGIITEADFLSLSHYLLDALDGLSVDALSTAVRSQAADPRSPE